MTRMEEIYRPPTLDEAFQLLKKTDPAWLETTLLDRWRHISASSTKTLQSDHSPNANSHLGPHDVTTPGFAASHELSDHLARFKSHDWSATQLGSICSWPSDLRRWTNVCMADPRPVAVWWGRDRVCLYNDAYQGILGGRNAWALGKSVNEVWFDEDPNTARFRAAFDHADATGQPTFGADTCFFVERSGFKEEVWAHWAVIPIMGAAGNIAFYNPVAETTKQILYDRRMATLLALEHETDHATELKQLWKSVLSSLDGNRADVPFAALYSVSEESSEMARRDSSRSTLSSTSGTTSVPGAAFALCQWELEGTLESKTGQLELPATIGLEQAIETFGPMLLKAIDSKTVQLIDYRDGSFPEVLRKKAYSRKYGDLCTSALIIPIAQRLRTSHRGFLALGLNPRCPYDQDYQKFTTLLASQLGRSVDAVCFSVEEARIAAIEAALASQERTILAEKLSMVELDVKDKEMRFRRMADMAMVGMFEVGADGTLTYANQTWYDMTAYPRGDFPPLDWVRTIHEDDRGWFADSWNRLTNGETLQFEIRFVKPYQSNDFVDGERLEGTTWAACAAYAEFKDGEVINVVGTVVDISRHKWIEDFQERRAAEAWELKRQQEAFMDMTSHETRNPLAAISLCVESILETCENILETPGDQKVISRDTIESTLDAANTIMACVAHQKTIIDDVLTLSKLNSGLLQTSPVEVQPKAEVTQAVKIFEAELQQADIELDFAVDDSYHRHKIDRALLDPVRLRQILINLLTNAIKFTKDEPSRRIAVSLAASAEPPVHSIEGVQYLNDSPKPAVSPCVSDSMFYLLITVKDTGRGIDKSELDHLFQRFKQGSPKTYSKYGGSGLGLFICKELARLQGGQIGVSSERGEGSTFSFYIRATKCFPNGTAQLKIPENASGDKDSKMTNSTHHGESLTPDTTRLTRRLSPKKPVSECYVLLVEDNLVNQRVMAKQLQRAGYTVTISNHGREALDHISTTHFAREGGVKLDVVLCDVEMPVMDGLECTRQIRKMEQEGILNGAVPLIAVTANARVEQQEEALRAGFNAVITKPFRMNNLLPELDKYCLSP